MAERRSRAADRAIRPPLRSPGRPPVNRREERQRFWQKIAEGLSSEDAAVAGGVSMPLGPRWFHEDGGMSPISLDPPSRRYSFTLPPPGAGLRPLREPTAVDL